MATTVTGLNNLYKKIDKIAKWSERDSNKLQAINHRVGDVYANYLKANIKDYGEDIRGTNKGTPFLIKTGQLRRSSGTWLPRKNSNTVLAGPRSKSIKPKGKTRKYSDGWFAHIVEKGDFGPRFGGKHRTQNTGVFSRGISATRGRSQKLQLLLLRRQFARYVKAA
tara:strand:+ start:156 stop:653 length:498 start_codon:yes stop_codon:yes gene_type:complete